MAEAKIIAVGPGEIGLISELYNQVFSPDQDKEFFRRRFRGRHNVSMLVALLDDQPAGFIVGFEMMPSTYFTWLCGVLPESRRIGVATQLIQAQVALAQEHHYNLLRFECQNQHRPMLHVAIGEEFELVGIRWETTTASNVVIFEKELGE